MITEKFKNDPPELKMELSAKPAFDLCSAALDDFYAGKYEASPFLLMLYDEGRMPFSTRVPRDSFVDFIKEALKRFPFTGTFETYLFILKKIFGEESVVLFEVPAPGKLEISVSGAATIQYDFTVREFIDGAFLDSQIVDGDGDTITFTGISGIDSEYKLKQLLAEIIPGGIFPTVTLDIFTLSDFVADEGGDPIQILDSDGNQIIFIEY